ncbi:MAG: hypothetical protein ABW047_09235 [Nitrospiraceae bacterium]
MRQRIAVVFVLAVSCLTVQSVAFSEEFTIDSPTWTVLRGQSTLGDPTYAPPLNPNQNIMRQAPALTGRFQLKDQTFIPFIGVGLGGGYTTDRDRALGSNWLQQNQTLSGDMFGKNMMPNEVNMGFRIPF